MRGINLPGWNATLTYTHTITAIHRTTPDTKLHSSPYFVAVVKIVYSLNAQFCQHRDTGLAATKGDDQMSWTSVSQFWYIVGLKRWSSQTCDVNIYTCHFLARCWALLRLAKDWLGQCQYVTMWDVRSCQWQPHFPVGQHCKVKMNAHCHKLAPILISPKMLSGHKKLQQIDVVRTSNSNNLIFQYECSFSSIIHC